MLTVERHKLIIEKLKEKQVVTIQELVKLTNTSESTIRRDLAFLEKEKYLKRVHGGAERLQGKLAEPDVAEKSTKFIQEKRIIAKHAASLIEKGDCIFLDAGTTIHQMIDFLTKDQNIVVVTNGLHHIDKLLKKGIRSYVVGGFMKPTTGAVIGNGALLSMNQYRFDKCFLGVNGIHSEFGYTTPDPEEAAVKQRAIQLARDTYVLADHSKFNEISFAKIADISAATIITDQLQIEQQDLFLQKTNIEVVEQ
ncbi:DeoR/GlpR family DNA-binding transcription regulator [Fervidibacillus halotolerans]|uniref:DeoR/GlpR family DNA-binding transcription regulator n=1 Tax=Fervidibacillus halotolerans TaxID=2980027 RepID=A0A9E8RWP4_9BACI|nr:DeoR/GlpR family DNA-binding transcription regulator [Fervidibacillus halotolerans]WAA11970.1 DeoR/GlpR family DNA-binding transcription regulator [Fervidibacillus halotolerans]